MGRLEEFIRENFEDGEEKVKKLIILSEDSKQDSEVLPSHISLLSRSLSQLS